MTNGDAVARWRAGGEQGDAALAGTALADGAVLISPLTAQFRFQGRDEVTAVMRAAFGVISDVRFHTEVGDGTTRGLFFHAKVGDLAIEEAQLLRLGADGLIEELTFFGRPLPGLTAVMHGIGPRLARQGGQPLMARFLSAATAPLAAITRAGDRHLVPLADPARRRGAH
jgi:hypothetical protein